MGDKKREKLARLGIATKGAVYCILGVLTALAAFNMGGSKSGSGDVIDFLAKQSYGQVLLIIMAIGLLGFVIWRMYQAFADTEGEGDDSKGMVSRAGYFVSGVFYGFLAYSAVKRVVGASSSSGDGGSSILQSLANKSYGDIAIGIIALILLGKAIYQFYRAYSGEFKEKIEHAGLDRKASKLMLRAGKIGFTARGIVAGILSYLFFRTAFASGGSGGQGKKDVFQFLENEFGPIVMGLVALGLVAYGVFMFIYAKYRRVHMS